MSATTQTLTEQEQTRETRAAESHVVVRGVFGDDFVFDFDSSEETHVVHTSGVKAEMCTCPDHQHRDVRCKHMAAYEDFSKIDEWDHV